MDGKRILFVGYRGKKSHVNSAIKAGAKLSLLINKREMKDAYRDFFEDIITVDDIYQWDQVKEAIKDKKFDGVLTRYEDFTVIVSGICDDRGLPAVPMEHARKFRNKYLMKKSFEEHGAPSADFVLISSMEEAEEFLSRNEFPLILKQISGIHSKFVTKVESREELEAMLSHYQKSLQIHADNLQRRFEGYPKDVEEPDTLRYFLLEECMEGMEIIVDSFIANGEMRHIPICKYLLSEDLGFNDHHLPVRVLPYDLPEEHRKLIIDTVERGYKALGADFCVTHAETFFEPEKNRCRLIEIAARGGGFRAEMLKHSTGEDYDLATVQVALGEVPDIGIEASKHAAVVEVFAPENGVLKSIDVSYIEGRDDVFFITHNKKIGEEVGRAADGRSYVVKFLIEADTYNHVMEEAENALTKIRESIEVNGE